MSHGPGNEINDVPFIVILMINEGYTCVLCLCIDIRLEGIGNRARAPYISIERSGDTPGSC